MILGKDVQDKMGEEIGMYMKVDGLPGIESTIRARTRLSPGEHLSISTIQLLLVFKF